MIHLKLGELDVAMNDSLLLALANDFGPRWLYPLPGEAISLEEQTFRISLGAVFRSGLWLMAKDLKKAGVPNEFLPHPPKGRGADIIAYAVQYIAQWICSQADWYEYQAEYVEADSATGGVTIQITGVAARARFPEGAAGATGVAADSLADAYVADVGGAPAQALARQPERQLVRSGDERDGQNDPRPASNQ